MDEIRRSVRLWTLPVLLALVFGAAACGDSEDEGSAAEQSPAPAEGQGGGGSDEDRIEAALREARRSFNAGDGPGFCSTLAAAGERQVKEFGSSYRTKGGCAQVVDRFSGNVERGQLPIEVVAIDVSGSKATARVRGGLAGSGVGSVRFVEEQGEWRIANPLTAQNRKQRPPK